MQYGGLNSAKLRAVIKVAYDINNSSTGNPGTLNTEAAMKSRPGSDRTTD